MKKEAKKKSVGKEWAEALIIAFIIAMIGGAWIDRFQIDVQVGQTGSQHDPALELHPVAALQRDAPLHAMQTDDPQGKRLARMPGFNLI